MKTLFFLIGYIPFILNAQTGSNSLTKASFVKEFRGQFKRIGIEFPIEDSELLLRYQASILIPLSEENYHSTLYGEDGLITRIDRLKKNPEDVEAARTIFGILKDGKVDDKEQPIINGLKNSFVNLKFQSSPRVDVIGDFLNDPEYKDIANLHREEYKIGNKESETVRVNLLDGSKQRTLFAELLAMAGVIKPMPNK